MPTSIVNLRQFYHSPLGRRVKWRLRRLVTRFCGTAEGLTIAGLGYTTDFLPFPEKLAANSKLLALMPHHQGAIYWPTHHHNHSALMDVARPPLLPSSLHRLVMAHLLEHESDPETCLRQWWHLLAPGGRLLLLVPNARSLWSLFGKTPWREGAHFTPARLKGLLNEAGFTVRDVRSVLYAIPSAHPAALALFSVLEALGGLLIPGFGGGVWVVEAEKQIYANVRGTPATSRGWKAFTPAPAPAAAPSPSLPPG